MTIWMPSREKSTTRGCGPGCIGGTPCVTATRSAEESPDTSSRTSSGRRVSAQFEGRRRRHAASSPASLERAVRGLRCDASSPFGTRRSRTRRGRPRSVHLIDPWPAVRNVGAIAPSRRESAGFPGRPAGPRNRCGIDPSMITQEARPRRIVPLNRWQARLLRHQRQLESPAVSGAAFGFDPFERVVDFLQRELLRTGVSMARTAS
jgi:hypothetical protein